MALSIAVALWVFGSIALSLYRFFALGVHLAP